MVTELWIYLEAVHCSFRAVLGMSTIFCLDVQHNMITKLLEIFCFETFCIVMKLYKQGRIEQIQIITNSKVICK